MNTLYNLDILLLGVQLTVGLPEIIICELGALVLGFTIHFFWNSKKDLDINEPAQHTGISENDNWKLKYYNDMDMQERAQHQLRERLTQVQETEQVLTIELEENRSETEELREELEIVHARLTEAESKIVPPPVMTEEPADRTSNYIIQLKLAQEKLAEHNNSITRLLEQTRLVEDSEKKTQELLRQNEELHGQIRTVGQQLVEKESEISHLRHHQKLAEEMGTRLDKVYEEYGTLQEKLLKLQTYLTQPYNRGTDYDELKDVYFKLGKEHDEMKLKYLSLREENQRMNRILADTEEKLKEANFQRQQYQKRSAFLEELNHDLQEISEHNKKIESQLRRVSDMETLLAKITGSGISDVS
jgi:type III secretory pathway component EscV